MLFVRDPDNQGNLHNPPTAVSVASRNLAQNSMETTRLTRIDITYIENLASKYILYSYSTFSSDGVTYIRHKLYLYEQFATRKL